MAVPSAETRLRTRSPTARCGCELPDGRLGPRNLAPIAPREYIRSVNVAVLSRDPEVMGGTAVFPATRVPVQTLIEYLEAGETIDDFLEGFPSVKREQVIAFLEAATERLVAATP